MATLKSDIDALTAEIEESKVDMKRASEDREIENKDFQETIADQRASQAILAKALARLEVFYAEKSFLQAKKQGQNPGSFQTYKKSEKSGGVMAMIQGVIIVLNSLSKNWFLYSGVFGSAAGAETPGSPTPSCRQPAGRFLGRAR